MISFIQPIDSQLRNILFCKKAYKAYYVGGTLVIEIDNNKLLVNVDNSTVSSFNKGPIRNLTKKEMLYTCLLYISRKKQGKSKNFEKAKNFIRDFI